MIRSPLFSSLPSVKNLLSAGWLSAIFASICLAITLPQAAADPIDDRVRAAMEAQHIPGVAIAVLKDGKLVKAEAYGHADRDAQRPVTTNTLFQIQSVTKIFTATGIMLLAEEGKIDIEARVSRYLNDLPASWSNVTVRHLLHHTSGIKDFINEPTVPLTNDVTPEGIIESLRKLPLNFGPGEKYRYSNTGYQLLGMIIHKLTGKEWHAFVAERIFKPAGMLATRVNANGLDLPDVARGYVWDKEKMRDGYPVAMSILSYPGGGLLSSVTDLAAWEVALRNGLLPKSMLEKMWTPARLNDGARVDYGLGWAVDDYQGHRYVSHGGAHMTGFKSIFMRFLDENLTVVVLANQRGANPANIALQIADCYIPGLLISSREAAKDPSPARTKKLRALLSQLARGKLPSALTPQFRASYKSESDRAWNLAARLKEAKDFIYIDSDDVSGKNIERLGVPVKTICYYKMLLKNEPRYYIFYLTADEKLAYYQSSEF